MDSAEIFANSKQILEESLQRCFKDESLKVKNIQVTPPSFKGENFSTKVEYVDVTVEAEMLPRTKIVPMFLKRAFISGPYAETLKRSHLYEKEADFFNVILPLLSDSGLVIDFVPVCYYACPEVVVLENLVASKGFVMNARSASGQDLAHVQQVVQTLARFHASSFVLKKKWEHPEVNVPEKYPILRDTLMGPNGKSGPGFFYTAMFKSIRCFLEQDGSFPTTLDVLRRIEPHILDIWAEMNRPKEPFNVICHSDCWNNNVMFLYASDDEEHKRPLQATLVDFQAICWSPVTSDLLYFLFTSTSLEFRRKHLTQVLGYYYQELSRILESLGIQEPEFTLDRLQEEFSCRKLFGLVCGLPMLASSLIPRKDTLDVADESSHPEDAEALFNHFLDVFSSLAKQSRCSTLAATFSDFVEDFQNEIQYYLQEHSK